MNLDMYRLDEHIIPQELLDINTVISEVQEVASSISAVNDSIIVCNDEMVDKINFSIITLPKAKDIFKEL